MKKDKKIKKDHTGFASEMLNGLGTGANVIGGGTAVLRDKTPSLRTFSFKADDSSGINTDPFGSWTGVPTDDPYEKPIQDADDL